MVLVRDYCRGENVIGKRINTYIRKNCVIGFNSIVLPRVIIDDYCVVAVGAVVTKHVSSNSMVAGNPTKILRKRVVVKDLGQILNKGKKFGDV